MKERDGLSRRDFLKITATAAASWNLVHIVPRALTSYTSLESRDVNNRFGVTVDGEEQTFRYKDIELRTIINPVAFRNSIESITEYKGGWDKMQNYISSNLINIDLYEELPRGVKAMYTYYNLLRRPRLIFPTHFIQSYADGVLSNNRDKILTNDITVSHELIHLWQDATINYTSLIDSAAQNTLIGIGAGVGLSIGIDKLIKEDEIGVKETLAKFGIPSTTGFLVGLVLSKHISPNFKEKQAHSLDDKVANLPGVAKYRGRFFHFEPSGSGLRLIPAHGSTGYSA